MRSPYGDVVVQKLWEAGAVDVAGYHELKGHEENPDAPKSPIYWNIRSHHQGGPVRNGLAGMIAHAICHLIVNQGLTFDYLAGVPDAGTPFARYVYNEGRAFWQQSWKILELVKTESGGKRRVSAIREGQEFLPEKSVLLLENVVTTGASVCEAKDVLNEEGLYVTDVVTILDFMMGGERCLAEHGIRLHSLVWHGEALDLLLLEDCILRAKYDEVLGFLKLQKV